MNTVYIDGVGIAAPGLHNWVDAQPVLNGAPWTETPLAAYAPALLPANEQRRATATVRIAFRVAEEAVRNGQYDARELATVFASSDADMMVSHRLCSALSQAQRLVSPTDFHNSVHNAPSGYWHIGAGSRQASSAVAGHDYTFAIGLLEALTQTSIESHSTLLVCYDVPAPEPLIERRPLRAPFATALIISPQRSAASMASLQLDSLNADAPETTLDAQLESLRTGNPAARALPLAALLARRQQGSVVLPRSAAHSIRITLDAR